jgi:hypothetical protein
MTIASDLLQRHIQTLVDDALSNCEVIADSAMPATTRYERVQRPVSD